MTEHVSSALKLVLYFFLPKKTHKKAIGFHRDYRPYALALAVEALGLPKLVKPTSDGHPSGQGAGNFVGHGPARTCYCRVLS